LICQEKIPAFPDLHMSLFFVFHALVKSALYIETR